MPVKIGFQVVACSGEDDRYRVNELNYHGPTVRGWRSPFNCDFPQEIVLRLQVYSVLQQIQILVHQYLIPRKIEICTDEEFDYEMPSFETIPDRFEYLGFITFSDNRETGFRSRELKSILIPSKKAKFVKLRIYENHINDKNFLNQVGIIGINILGEKIEVESQESEYVNNNHSSSNGNVCCRSNPMYTSIASQNSMNISPYDDLAFEMYVDGETAEIIKILVQRKQEAIFEENFELARLLKITLEDLRAAGEILGLYEQEKKQAIQVEDFDRAKLKKLQIANFRDKVYSALNIRHFLDLSKDEGEYISPPDVDDINNDNVIKSTYNISDSNYQDRYLSNIQSPRKQFTHQNGGYSHIIHSKSQTSFTNLKDITASYLKNQTFTSSLSNPQLHQYLQDAQKGDIRMIPQTESKGREYERTPSPTSSSSESEESAVFNAFPSESVDYKSLPNMPTEEGTGQAEVEDKTESVSVHWSGVKTPPEFYPERSRSRTQESSRARSKSMTHGKVKSSFEAYEDRMLPALRSYHGNEMVRECQLAFDQQSRTTLNERERKQALLPISVFGIEIVEKFYSRSFNDKEEGLRLLQQELKRIVCSGEGSNGIMSGSHNKMARAAIFLLHRALREKVYSVYSGAAETIRLFFTEFIPQRVSSSEVARSIEKLLPELLTKAGDVTPRIHNMAAHTILSIAECEEVRRLNIIQTHLSRPLMSSVHPRLALSRLEMVEQLILNHGISKDKRSGLTCRTLAEFGSSGLHHPTEAVRKVSERILIHVYKVNPRMVRKQLPPDDNVTRRNLLYRQLFQEFDFMDVQRKMSEQNNETEEQNPAIQSYDRCKTDPSPDRKSFCINVNQDAGYKKSRNFMMLNLREKNTFEKTRKSPQKFSGHKSPSKKGERIDNEMPAEVSPKVNFRLETTSSLPRKNQNVFFEETTTGKAENGAKSSFLPLIDRNRFQKYKSNVKFPNLTDSIDTTKARLMFDTKKSPTTKKDNRSNGLSQLLKEQVSSINGDALPKKEAKKNTNNTSGIPLPTFNFAKKHYHATKRPERDKKPNAPPQRLSTRTGIPKIKSLNKPIQSDSTTKKNIGNTDNQKAENENGQTKSQRMDSDVINRFSESMLASIRENECSDDVMSNGLDKEQTLKTCIFCLSSDKWTNDDTLNNHYLNDCPMLTTCEYCTEVIEIVGFENHLLDECTQKHLFQKCLKCQQPVLADLLENHECTGFLSQIRKTRCPFCHANIGDDDTCWRDHFVGENVCPNHPRLQ